jgi:hypothetical protein
MTFFSYSDRLQREIRNEECFSFRPFRCPKASSFFFHSLNHSLHFLIVTMLPHWFPTAAFLSATAGPVSHYAIWANGEWDGVFHTRVPSICLSQVLAFFLLHWSGQGWLQSFYILTLLVVSYMISLFTSITIYRLFLHPTRIYRGPFLARLSSWWRVKTFIDHNEQAFAVTHKLHHRYGDIVRVGTVFFHATNVVFIC